MPIKKTKLTHKHKSKKFMKKMLSHKKTKKHMKSHMKSHSKSHSKRHSKSKSKNIKKHRGGFSSCNLATVKESGFSVDALGSIAGINIPSSRGAIYRPNCKSDSSQAMTP
jgi:hypothetical protein